jgi:hypothetical protein
MPFQLARVNSEIGLDSKEWGQNSWCRSGPLHASAEREDNFGDSSFSEKS